MKNAVVTYIFGENRELLREPLVVDKDTEYICVTDQTKLKSNVWKLVYDPMPEIRSLRDKVANIKFNPFKYTTAKNIFVIDGSMEIKESLISLFDELKDYDIGLKLHTFHKTLKEELPYWVPRGLSKDTIKKFYKMAKIDNIDLANVVEYEGSLLLYKNTNFCKNFGQNILKFMKFLGEKDNMIVTNQCPMSYWVHKNFKDTKILFIDQFKYMNRYIHNTNRINKT